MRLGIRAHDIGTLPVDDLAARAAAEGFSSVQLAVAKAVKDMPSEPGVMMPAHASAMRDAFATRGVAIAVLGCYINPVDPDRTARRKALDRFRFYLSMAPAFGGAIVGTETGSHNADQSFHPDNESEETLAALISSMAELVAEAERHGSCVGIEGVTSHVATTPARLKRVLDAIPSPALKVIFDPVNFLDAGNAHRQTEVFSEAFALFGSRMAILHLKDFRMENGVLRSAPACSTGNLDTTFLLSRLPKTGITDILLEDTPQDRIAQTRADVVREFSSVLD